MALEPAQAELLDQICSGPLITAAELAEFGALHLPPNWRKTLQANPDLPLATQTANMNNAAPTCAR